MIFYSCCFKPKEEEKPVPTAEKVGMYKLMFQVFERFVITHLLLLNVICSKNWYSINATL